MKAYTDSSYVKIGIVEDDYTIRQSLKDYFIIAAKELDIQYKIIFSVESIAELSKLQITDDVNFIILDIHLKDENGIEHIKELNARFDGAQIIVITGDTYNEGNLLKAVKMGAKSFIYKPFKNSDLHVTMKNVLSTGSHLEPTLRTKLMQLLNGTNFNAAKFENEGLTKRQLSIVVLLLKGLKHREIAEHLGISTYTVNNHIQNIYFKLDIKSRSELLRMYQQMEKLT